MTFGLAIVLNTCSEAFVNQCMDNIARATSKSHSNLELSKPAWYIEHDELRSTGKYTRQYPYIKNLNNNSTCAYSGCELVFPPLSEGLGTRLSYSMNSNEFMHDSLITTVINRVLINKIDQEQLKFPNSSRRYAPDCLNLG